MSALRVQHAVKVKAVRDAVRYAQQAFKIDRLLLRPELRAQAGELFLGRYGELVNLSKSGQLAMRKLLEAYLERVDWKGHLSVRLYPFVSGEMTTDRRIVIDPEIAFGRPVVSRARRRSRRRSSMKVRREPDVLHGPRSRKEIPCHPSRGRDSC